MHIKIALTDDHPLIIGGIKNLLHYYKHIEIIDTYADGNALLEGLKERRPDVLLLDIQLPDRSGNELARLITRNYPDIRILVLTSNNSTFHLKDMIRSGCKGYILKTADKEALVNAIEEVYQGREYLEPSLKDQLLNKVLKLKPDTQQAHASLTSREKEVLALIANEMTSQEIAAHLHISQRTVENHRFSLMQKLHVKNTAGMTKAAMEMGLI